MDSPVSPAFPNNQSVEAVNVDYRNGGLGRKRHGAYDVLANTTGETITVNADLMIRHVRGSGGIDTGEIWVFERKLTAYKPNYLPAGTTVWGQSPSTIQMNASAYYDTWGVSLGGKLFIFRHPPVGSNDRTLVFDEDLADFREAGLSLPGLTLSAADNGVGTYAATIRYYRYRAVYKVAGQTRLVSEPTTAISFTPSGTGLRARLSLSASTFECATHWRLEASGDNLNFYIVADTALGSTYDDSAAVSSYANGTLSDVFGTYTLYPAVQYAVTDGNRLIMVGHRLTTGRDGSRVWWTPVLGSLYPGDNERLLQTATLTPYLDLNDKDGGDATGIGQINGVVYVFKWHQVWRLSPTGDLAVPYTARCISHNIGCISQRSIQAGEDTVGNPYLYFMSSNGPYRVGMGGLQYLGRDIEDLTTLDGVPNINTSSAVKCHSVYHNDLGQWWLWFATGTSVVSDTLVVLDVKQASRFDEFGIRGGWTRYIGDLVGAYTSCPHLASITNIRPRFLPWIALGGPFIVIGDRDDVQTDKGTAFQSYVKTKSLVDPNRLGALLEMREAIIIASHHTAADVTIRATVDRDLGQELATSDVTIVQADIDKDIIKKFEDLRIADATVLQLQIGDSAATANRWQIDFLKYDVSEGGEK